MAERSEFMRQVVCDDRSHTNLNSIQRLQHKQSQTAVELVKVDDLIEIRPCSKVVRSRNSKGNEVSAQSVVSDSLKPLYCPAVVAAIETPVGQQGHLLLVRERWFAILHPKKKPADLSFTLTRERLGGYVESIIAGLPPQSLLRDISETHPAGVVAKWATLS
jgi:hypothetical protein